MAHRSSSTVSSRLNQWFQSGRFGLGLENHGLDLGIGPNQLASAWPRAVVMLWPILCCHFHFYNSSIADLGLGLAFQQWKVKQAGLLLSIAPLTWDKLKTKSAFTISEVAADWHELMIPQRTTRPSIARVSQQSDPRLAASRHTTAPITISH